ncbi:hypothetical protein GGF42_007195 [Coemansia sp. RSA 2424]|nr:hypothetical protein GGF42_007195 [Coemansia sp. RSA 2424]
MSDFVDDVDVGESLVEEVEKDVVCKSLELNGAVTVTVTMLEVGEDTLSVVRKEPINSGIDVLIGYSIDRVPICCSDIIEMLLDDAVMVAESVDNRDELELLLLLGVVDGNGIVLVIPLESVDDEVELEDGQLALKSGHDKLDEVRPLDDSELDGMLCSFSDDSENVVELLVLELLALLNHALKLPAAGDELDALRDVVDEVAKLEEDDGRKSVPDVASSVIPKWSSANVDVVDADILLVGEAGEDDQRAAVGDVCVLRAIVNAELELGAVLLVSVAAVDDCAVEEVAVDWLELVLLSMKAKVEDTGLVDD